MTTAQTQSGTGITVAGRTFRPVISRSDGRVLADQYNYTLAAIWAVDVAGVENMRDVFFRLAQAGQIGALLSGLVVEVVEGDAQPWTAKEATKLAAWFNGPHTVADMLAIQAAVLEVLPDFFPGVLGYYATSAPVSAEPETPASISATPTTSATPSASSAPTSDSSPATIPTSSPALDAGA